MSMSIRGRNRPRPLLACYAKCVDGHLTAALKQPQATVVMRAGMWFHLRVAP